MVLQAYYRASKAALELDELVTAADMATAVCFLKTRALRRSVSCFELAEKVLEW